ncbi:hypothetical protein Tco_0750818 [Tanacetum coccineum]|uniref:Uncharacterized protein n=1 Tax=Tanacetum coccineum TaxID=301880 RepID=A0ABQ4Z524_9ASTR
MPTQTIPMLSKKPKKATADLHKDILGTRNPGLGYMAKRAQPVLYDADTLLHPNHHPVSIWDSEEVLVHQVVSMKKMNEKPGHVRPANGFYDKLNALMFVPQKELSGDQAYWLLPNEIVILLSPPSSNYLCEDLRSACDREHTKVLELEAEISKQKQLISDILRIPSREKMTLSEFDAQINIMKVLNVTGRKRDLKRRYDELSKANNHSRIAYTEKLSAFTAENTKLKAQVTGKTSSGPSTSETPKVLASGTAYTKQFKRWRPNRKVVGSVKPSVENPWMIFAVCSPIANLVIERLVPRGYLVFLNAKALSNGHTVADSIGERLKRPTAYQFKTDCSIIPVWVF